MINLSLATSKRPVLLVLDGIDSLSPGGQPDGQRSDVSTAEALLRWLPLPLPPPHVYLLLSCGYSSAALVRSRLQHLSRSHLHTLPPLDSSHVSSVLNVALAAGEVAACPFYPCPQLRLASPSPLTPPGTSSISQVRTTLWIRPRALCRS